MSEDREIIVCREDKPDDEEVITLNKSDRVLQLLKLAKAKLYPGENIPTADLFAYQIKEGEKSLIKKAQKISELSDVDQIEIRHKSSKKGIDTKEEKQDTIKIWAARESNQDATVPIDIAPGKTVYDLLKLVKDELFNGKDLDELQAVEFSSKEIIPRQATIKDISDKGTTVLFRFNRMTQEVEVEKLKFNQEEEIKKVREAKKKIDAARKEASNKTIEEKNEILKELQADFGIKDAIPKNTTREDAEKILNNLEDALSKEESELTKNNIDFKSFSVKDRCQELMTHISGNCVSYEIDQPIVSNITNEKIYKFSSEELHRRAGNKLFSTSEDENWKFGVDAAVPVNAYCNISALVSHGREKSTSSEGGRKNEDIKRSTKATVSNRHYQQIIKFKIAKTSLSTECEKDAEKLGEGHQNKDLNTEESELLDFLKKYPEKVYTGPFGAGGWFEFNTTVETSQDEDISKLRNIATDQNKKQSEIASNLTVAGLGGGSLEYESQEISQKDERSGSLSNNTSSSYTTNTTFVCEGPPNTRTPTSLTARLTSPNNWTVFPSCDEKTPVSFLTPIYDIIRKIADEKNVENLKRAASKLENILKNGPKYIIREAIIPPKARESSRLKNVMCFGKTGQGKSLLGNVILGEYEAFEVGEGTRSCTKKSKDVENKERRIRIHDTYGLSDTADQKLGMNFLAGSKKAMEAILETWEAIGTDGLDVVIFVQNRKSKVTAEDAAVAKYAKEKLFGGDIGERAFLVLTESTPKQIMEKPARLQFLEEESKDTSGHFATLYKMVNSDPNKVLFVNNKNPDPDVLGEEEEVIKAKQHNVSMAELVLQAIHSIDLPPQETPVKFLEARRLELELQINEMVSNEEKLSFPLDSHSRSLIRRILANDEQSKKRKLINKITNLGLKSTDIPPELTSLIEELKDIEKRKEKIAKDGSWGCNIL